MAQSDPAFLWETEALRSSPMPSGRARDRRGRHEVWITLREAHQATGIPIATLRNWARRRTVPSYLDETRAESRRMVRLPNIRDRARELGRDTDPVETAPSPGPDGQGPSVDLTSAAGETETSPPPGTMIVPIEAWDKMLLQLGNLHQAGQQLAEARERAAKAETEARFLRERLAELRQEREQQDPGASPAAEDPTPETEPATVETPGRVTMTFWRLMARRWLRD